MLFQIKKFSLLLLILFIGCSNSKDSSSMKKIHWDRDMCEYCKMVVSDRSYAVEVINPKTNRYYLFDDIGCTILWFKESKIAWEKDAIIYISDAKSQKFINAKEAYYTLGKLTPMDYGFSAYKSKDEVKAKEFFRYDEMRLKILRGETMQNPSIRKVYK